MSLHCFTISKLDALMIICTRPVYNPILRCDSWLVTHTDEGSIYLVQDDHGCVWVQEYHIDENRATLFHAHIALFVDDIGGLL